MYHLANILTALVAVLHAGFLLLEMVYWDRPLGLRIFGHGREFARASKVLAMNQGLYNGFLAAGLAWALYLGEAGYEMQLFLLGCVVVAGVFGGISASRHIFLVQALPALVALILLVLARP